MSYKNPKTYCTKLTMWHVVLKNICNWYAHINQNVCLLFSLHSIYDDVFMWIQTVLICCTYQGLMINNLIVLKGLNIIG